MEKNALSRYYPTLHMHTTSPAQLVKPNYISQHLDGTGTWNTVQNRTRATLSRVVSTIAADDPATQGAGTSAAVVMA